MQSAGFQRILLAEGVSNFGEMLSRLAIPWLATLSLEASPLQMGWLVVADVSASAIGALTLGTLIDRLDAKLVMVTADVLRAVVRGILIVVALLGALSMPALLCAAAIGGFLTVAFELARSAWVGKNIAAAELPGRNAQLSVAGSLSETLAFALGGWLFQGLGAIAALAIDAASYLFSGSCLTGVPSALVQRDAGRLSLAGYIDEAQSGLRTIISERALWRLGALEILYALGLSIAGTSYMIFVTRDLHFTPGPLGIMFATGAIGAMIGAGAAPFLGRVLGHGRALAIGALILAVATFWLPLAYGAGAGAAALVVLNQVIGDAGQTIQHVHDRTLRQTLVPAGLLARVDGGLRMLGYVATLAGAILGGMFATMHGTRSALALAAAFYAASAIVAFSGWTSATPDRDQSDALA